VSKTANLYTCVYCKKPKNEDEFDRAHVIAEALGGKLRVSEMCCKSCNSRLGTDVESHLINLKPISYARTVLRLPGASGDIPSTIMQRSTGAEYMFRPDGVVLPSIPYEESRGEDGQLVIRVSGASMDEVISRARGVIGKKIQRGKLPEKDISGGSVKLLRTRERSKEQWSPLEFSHDSSLIGRAMAHIAFNFLSSQFERDLVLTKAFDPIRDYIQVGKSVATVPLCVPEYREFFPKGEDPDGLFHRVTVYCDGDLGNVIALVELFRYLRWAVVLAWQYTGPHRDVSLTNILSTSSCDIRWGTAKPLIPTSTITRQTEEELEKQYEYLKQGYQYLCNRLCLMDARGRVDDLQKWLLGEFDGQHPALSPETAFEKAVKWFAHRSSPCVLVKAPFLPELAKYFVGVFRRWLVTTSLATDCMRNKSWEGKLCEKFRRLLEECCEQLPSKEILEEQELDLASFLAQEQR